MYTQLLFFYSLFDPTKAKNNFTPNQLTSNNKYIKETGELNYFYRSTWSYYKQIFQFIINSSKYCEWISWKIRLSLCWFIKVTGDLNCILENKTPFFYCNYNTVCTNGSALICVMSISSSFSLSNSPIVHLNSFVLVLKWCLFLSPFTHYLLLWYINQEEQFLFLQKKIHVLHIFLIWRWLSDQFLSKYP